MRHDAMKLLRSDYNNSCQIEDSPSTVASAMSKRSVFKWVTVQQLVKVCEQLGWSFASRDNTREVAWISARYTLPVGSLFNETCFKYMRALEAANHRVSKVRKWIKPVLSPLVNSDFKYTPVDVSTAPVPPRAESLPKTLFKPEFREAWEAIRDVAGPTKLTPWTSENSETATWKYMDILALRFLAEHHESQWSHLDYVWQTCLLDVPQIMVKRLPDGEWQLPLGSIGSSGALVLDLTEYVIPHRRDDESSVSVFVPTTPITAVKSAHVVITNSWVAQTFEYKSPHWVMLHQDIAQEEDSACMAQGDAIDICLFPTCAPTTLKEASARKCFGKFGVALLRKLASLWDIPLRHTDGTLFAILVVMISTLLGCDEDTLLDILCLRLEDFLTCVDRYQGYPRDRRRSRTRGRSRDAGTGRGSS